MVGSVRWLYPILTYVRSIFGNLCFRGISGSGSCSPSDMWLAIRRDSWEVQVCDITVPHNMRYIERGFQPDSKQGLQKDHEV